MIKTFKWIYKLGYDNARNSILTELERASEFHRQQAQIASRREDDKYDQPRMSAADHKIAAKTLDDMLASLDPIRHPNIDRLLEKML